jgi:hypothetical protein
VAGGDGEVNSTKLIRVWVASPMELIYEGKAMQEPLILPQDTVEGGVSAEEELSQTMGAIGPRLLMPTPKGPQVPRGAGLNSRLSACGYTHRGYKSGSHDTAEVAWELRAVTPTYMWSRR